MHRASDDTGRPREPRDASAADLVGSDRLARNVMSGWAGYSAVVVSGFVVPRMISDRLGPELLGIWDFGWALTALARLLPGGTIPSVARFVAGHRAAGEPAGVNRVASSASVLLGGFALGIVALAALAALALPPLLGAKLGAHTREAQWVVAILGTSIAIDIGFGGFGGVLAGFHRFDLFHGIEWVRRVLALGASVAVLLLGGGVVALGIVVLAGSLASRLARAVAAHRVAPTLSIRWRNADRRTALAVLGFGGKSLAPQLGSLLLGQTVGLVVMAALGPAAVAVFSRSQSLTENARTLVGRYAMVIGPTASALDALGRRPELRDLLVRSTRAALYVAVPLFLAFALLGGPLLRVWMGPGYEETFLLALLAFGSLFVMVTQPALAVLSGINAHGRPGLARLGTALAAIAGVVAALGPLHAGLVGVGLAVAIPMAVVNGVYLPLYACRRIGLPLGRLAREAGVRPLLCALPVAASFAVARASFPGDAWAALGAGAAGAGLLAGPLYWRHALPDLLPGRLRRGTT